jgi:hypothetical protein
MQACSIQNRDTKEPKIFYKSDRGGIYTSLYDVLNNSDNSYETGYVNKAGEFFTQFEVPVFDKSTLNGQIQGHIKNGYLTGRQVAPNTYEATDSMAAEILEKDLVVNNYNQYERIGNNFVFGDFSPKIATGTPSSISNQIKASNIYTDMLTKKETRPVTYTEDQLKQMIENFMDKAGFSIQTIESYKQNYEAKFGVEPNAEALIDLQNKVIAVIDGEITLDQLSEEFSHFVIEAWNQEEISRMLQTVNNTQEYIENAEQYREVYSKQISDPVELENAVRREVLGKMLANSLQTDFSIENRTATETGFFNKLSQILRDFLNMFRSNINTDLRNSIDKMAQDIQNKLYNDNLAESLNMNYNPTLKVMYSLNKDSIKKIKDAVKNIDVTTYNNDTERQVDELFNTALSSTIASNDSLANLSSTEVMSPELADTIENLLDVEDLLSQVASYFRRMNINETTFNDERQRERALKFKNNILAKADRVQRDLADLKGNYRNIKENHDPLVIAEKLAEDYTDLSETQRQKLLTDSTNAIRNNQKDTSGWYKLFGHVSKSSNTFVNLLSQIINSLQAKYKINFLSDMQEFIEPLKQYRDKLKNFVKDGYFRSGIDNNKLYRAERQFELSILQEVYPEIYENMDLDAFVLDFQENGIPSLKDKNNKYYHYKYLYDTKLQSQDWINRKAKDRNKNFVDKLTKLNLGATPWENEFYKAQADLSAFRGRNAKSSIEQRRSDSSPYYESGDIKKGFTPIFYEDAQARVNSGSIKKEDIVATNPRFSLFEGTNQPNPRDLVFFFDKTGEVSVQAELAYNYMQWNALNLSAQDPNIRQTIKDNFRADYESQLKALRRQGLSENDVEKGIRDWLNDSLFFEATEEYWENFTPSGIDFDGFYKFAKYQKGKDAMRTLEQQYQELALQKRLILRKYKSQNDYKEVDVKSISNLDKDSIYNLEEQMSQKREEISQLFDDNDLVSMYLPSTSESSLRMNQAFHEMFSEIVGKPFEEATTKELELFFSNRDYFQSTRYGTYLNLKKELKNETNSGFVETYRDHARTLGLDPANDEAVQKAFLIVNSPSWYKRYDANQNYDNFIREYNSGKIDILDLLDNYLNSDVDQVMYNGSPMNLMRITPSFKYSVPSEPNIEDLYEEYKQSTDNLEKYQLAQEMGGINNIDPTYSTDMTDILNNAENLKAYTLMMDAHFARLEKDKMLKKPYIYLMAQERKTDYERFEAFVKNKEKLNQVKDYAAEMLSFRADDFEESYKSLKIPKYGYFRLKPEELTTDVFHTLVWGLNNANLYDQRYKHWRDATSAIQGLEGQNFEKGKRATDTNYYHIMKEMLDFNFYGKTLSTKIELDIPIGAGKVKTIDMSKFLFGFRNLGINFALAFSPIVAMTNFSSGVVQNLIMSGTGRNIYSPSNKRAVAMLAKMFPESIKDIGNFDPEAKINKIMYSFGVYNLSERYANAKYSKALRLLPEASFSLMAMTNFPLEAQSVLTKLMEYRLVDGKFLSWRNYSTEAKVKDPSLTNKEIKANFEALKSQSMYDFLDDNGNFDEQRLQDAGYTGNIEKDKVTAMTAIRSIAEQTTMEIAKHHEGYAGRDPRWSFILSLKKWLVMATSTMFSRRRTDLELGGEEEGLIYTPKYFYDIFKAAIKDKQNILEAYDDLDEVAQKNVKTSLVIAGTLGVMLAMAVMLKKAADDDDEEDNYLLQLSAYMALRNLNEAFSGNIGIGQSYFEAVQNPVMLGSTVKNMTNVFKFGDIGETTEGGKYDGVDKYMVGLMKATWLRNPYTVSNVHALSETRKSYEFFNTQNSFYHIFDLIPAKPKDDAESK